MKQFLLYFLLFLSFFTLKSQEQYLMITAPEYESTLHYFANYKRNIGFQVRVVSTNITGKTPESIKNYIQNQYNNISTRPIYVLLVGDVDKIPAYEGDPSGTVKNNPISDLGYSIMKGKDYLADIFLGRFSISNDDELKNIINKTIFMEINLHRFTKKAKFLTGDDKTATKLYMKNNFKRGNDYAVKNCFKPSHYQCASFYQPDDAAAIVALSDNPLFFLYAGHGSFNYLAGYSFSMDSKKMMKATHTVFPFVFAFACKSGNFAHPQYVAISESFIRAKKGAVAYFGASVNTTTDSDIVMVKKLFGKPFQTENQSLAAFINSAMKQFANSHIVNKKVIRNLKSYNLLGDPSINMSGVPYLFNYNLSYSDSTKTAKESDIINPAKFSIFQNPNSNEFSLAYTLERDSFVQIDIVNEAGELVKNLLQIPTQKIGVYYCNFLISDLISGTYTFVFKDSEKTISYVIKTSG